jgi:methylated-DNA-protein-cysteine methyltransferase related protein
MPPSGTTRKEAPLYRRIYAIARQIPPGQVATYGQIAHIVGWCTARVVGYAMAALPAGTDVPWHRVINREGKVSPRRSGDGGFQQCERLEAEGVCFDRQGRVDLTAVGWGGPDRCRVQRHKSARALRPENK